MQIFKQLIEIALRKREPQDLTYSLEVAILLTASMAILRYISFNAMESLSNPIAYSVASVVGECALIYILLRRQNKANRFVQTLTALFGIALIATAVSVLMAMTVILQLALPVLLIWSIYLAVIILRSALECSTLKALLLTIAYKTFGYLMVILLFPKFEAEMLLEWEKIKVVLEATQLEAQSK